MTTLPVFLAIVSVATGLCCGCWGSRFGQDTSPQTFAMYTSRLLVLTLLISCVALSTASIRVRVSAWHPSSSPTPGSAHTAVANRVGNDTDLIYPTKRLLSNLPVADFYLDVGEYEIAIREEGFYFYKGTLTITPADYSVNFKMWLVPIAQGATVMVNLYASGATKFHSSILLPSTAGFTSSSTASHTKNMWGTPPAAIADTIWTTALTGAPAGTYRLHMLAFPTGLSTSYNFTQGEAVMTLFVGSNPETGFVGNWKSRNVDSTAWYVGDLVVTTAAPGCSRYHWQEVNIYPSYAGQNMEDHGQGRFLAEECVDVSPAAMACATPLFDDAVQTDVCGAFGDPHVVMFNRTGVTCGFESVITLVDNDYFSITADTTFLNESNFATAIKAINVEMKGYCNPTRAKFTDLGAVIINNYNSPHASRHSVIIVRNNLYVDAFHLRVQVRALDGNVVFGISMPRSLAALSTGVCTRGCTPGTRIDHVAESKKRDPQAQQLALDACTDAGLTSGTFEYDACIFDITTSGESKFASNAALSLTVRSEVGEAWSASNTPYPPPLYINPLYYLPSYYTPSNPSANAPAGTSDTSTLSFRGVLLCALAIILYNI